jgi:hypothetical protein
MASNKKIITRIGLNKLFIGMTLANFSFICRKTLNNLYPIDFNTKKIKDGKPSNTLLT